MPPPVTRFAPSPTGLLHLGNARTAYFSWLHARGSGGRFIVRVEDTDAERCREEFLAAQLDDLRWLGLDWDAGPGRDDERGPYRQSLRGDIYAGLYRRLEEAGHAYPCYCSPVELDVSRRAQLAAGRPPRYAGTCRELSAAARQAREAEGRVPTLRFRVPERRRVAFDDLVRGPQAFEAADIGDFIVRRADGSPAFFFCNAVDDALMGITCVLRGEDHVANTPRQMLVLEALGLPVPQYGHVPLIVGADGTPLSKRHGSASLADLRERGYLPGAAANYLLRLGHHGAPEDWLVPADLPRHFSLARVGRSPSRFDEQQLLHWQREAVKRLDVDSALTWLGPALPPGLSTADARRLADLVRHNVLFPDDAAPWAQVLFDEPAAPSAADRELVVAAGDTFFAAALAAFDVVGADAGALGRELKARTGRKGAALFMPLRVALTGRSEGPELGPLLRALPPDKIRARFAAYARPPG